MLVWDQHAMRYSTFTASRGYIDRAVTRRKNLSDLLIRDYYYEHMYPASDGSLIVETTPRINYSEKEAARPAGEFIRPTQTLVWVNTDFTSYRKLGEHGGIEQIKLNVAGRPVYFVSPSGVWPHQSVGASPPRICVDAMRGPQVECYDSDGGTLYIRWRSAPVELPAGTFERWVEREAKAEARLRASAAQVRAAFEGIPRPEHAAAVAGIAVDALGWVWVRSADLRGETGLARYRVFTRDGELAGYAAIPAPAIREIGREHMLASWQNTDGVEHVTVFRIQRELAASR
jgi:hypothetical protein